MRPSWQICVLISCCRDHQAQTGQATTASLQSELAAATSQATKLQQTVDAVERELSAARAEASDSKSQVEAVRQHAQQEMQVANAAFKSELAQKQRQWKVSTAAAVADQAARDDALRKCLHAEVEAAAQQDKESLKKDSSAAMSQQAAEWQAQLSQLHAEHDAALAHQAAEFESKHAQQAQHAAADAQQGLEANASKLQQAYTAALAKQAEQSAEQLADCKRRYVHNCWLQVQSTSAFSHTATQ